MARKPGTVKMRPAPTLDTSWHDHAACKSEDPALFFNSDESEEGFERAQRERAARRVCASCPVSTECLRHALTRPEEFGIWGGLNPAERERLRSRQVPA